MSDEQKSPSQKLADSTPISKQVVRLITATTMGAALLGLSAVTLTGTVVAVILATPLLVIFSPILVPAAEVLFSITVGFLFSGGCGVAAIAALRWIYNYVAGKRPLGEDELDFARMKIGSTGRDI